MACPAITPPTLLSGPIGERTTFGHFVALAAGTFIPNAQLKGDRR